MNESSPAAEIARSPAAWERLAKGWLVEVIERTPLADVDELPLSWIAQEAPPLIAEILGQLSDPGSARDLELPPATRERAASLAAQRPAAAAGRLPRELAALQSLLIEAIGREAPPGDRIDVTRAIGRLAEVFGAVQAAAMTSLVAGRSAGAADPQTGLAGPTELFQRIRLLATEHAQSRVPFAVTHIEVEGAERIAAGYGEEAATQMVNAAAGILDGNLTDDARAFRVGPAQFVVVSPGRGLDEMLEQAVQLADLVERSQSRTGPRVALSMGIAACPAHGASPEGLLDDAEQAAWSARAAGEDVARAPQSAVQDP